MSRPNLFSYATKELSQDAFLCWLLDWANKDNSQRDPVMHRMGCMFLNALLAKHSVGPVDAPRVEIRKPFMHADIVAIVNDKLILVIEDKTHTREHDDQLSRYKAAISKEFPDGKILGVFAKTGDQCSYHEVEGAGYALFLRADFLRVLRKSREMDTSNTVLLDFLEVLEQQDSRVESYASDPVSVWTKQYEPWIGFYKELQRRRKDLEWEYVPNQAGGFLGAWWHSRKWQHGCHVYLQIEQGPLCLKIAVPEDHESERSAIREKWYAVVMETAKGALPLEVKRPRRFGTGSWMTVAYVERAEWMGEGTDGRIDFLGTMKNLQVAERLLERAAKCAGDGAK